MERGAWEGEALQKVEGKYFEDATETPVLSECLKFSFKTPGGPPCLLLLALMFDSCGNGLGQLFI